MNEVWNRLMRSKVLVLVYVLGILFQALYLPYYARQSSNLLSAGMDAGYSWVWDRPIYYDMEKDRNISQAEVEAWKAQSTAAKEKAGTNKEGLFGTWFSGFGAESKLPVAWVQIYGIAYMRLFFTLAVWTVVTGGAFVLLKKSGYNG